CVRPCLSPERPRRGSSLRPSRRRAGLGQIKVQVRHGGCPSGRLRDRGALRQSLTKRKVLAWALEEADHQVIRRYSGTSDDPRVQFLEQGKAGLFRPTGDERDFKHEEVVGVFHPEKRPRVQEAVAPKLMDDLEK